MHAAKMSRGYIVQVLISAFVIEKGKEFKGGPH